MSANVFKLSDKFSTESIIENENTMLLTLSNNKNLKNPSPSFVIEKSPKSNIKISSYNIIIRRDNKGVPIVKGGKNHHILFKDYKGKPLVDIVNIESYKSHNSMDVEINNDLKQESTSCCLLF